MGHSLYVYLRGNQKIRVLECKELLPDRQLENIVSSTSATIFKNCSEIVCLIKKGHILTFCNNLRQNSVVLCIKNGVLWLSSAPIADDAMV